MTLSEYFNMEGLAKGYTATGGETGEEEKDEDKIQRTVFLVWYSRSFDRCWN
jgi:hypothetical protein